MMKVKTYLNEGAGRFTEYRPDDRMVKGPEVAVLPPWSGAEAVRGPEWDMEIAEQVYTVGNRMAEDAEGREWPTNVRSLSVGDVIVIGETAYAVDVFGWITLTDFRPVTAVADGRGGWVWSAAHGMPR